MQNAQELCTTKILQRNTFLDIHIQQWMYINISNQTILCFGVPPRQLTNDNQLMMRTFLNIISRVRVPKGSQVSITPTRPRL